MRVADFFQDALGFLSLRSAVVDKAANISHSHYLKLSADRTHSKQYASAVLMSPMSKKCVARKSSPSAPSWSTEDASTRQFCRGEEPAERGYISHTTVRCQHMTIKHTWGVFTPVHSHLRGSAHEEGPL